MQIPKELPQFKNRSTLLIVSGGQTATLYVGRDGVIEERTSFSIPNPEYSDREGHFARRGRGQQLGSGSAYEPKQKDITDAFLNELTDNVHKAVKEEKVKDIVLFAPQHELSAVTEALHKEAGRRLSETFNGNYTKEHPTKLLKHLKEKRSVPTDDLAEGEAKDILDKDTQ